MCARCSRLFSRNRYFESKRFEPNSGFADIKATPTPSRLPAVFRLTMPQVLDLPRTVQGLVTGPAALVLHSPPNWSPFPSLVSPLGWAAVRGLVFWSSLLKPLYIPHLTPSQLPLHHIPVFPSLHRLPPAVGVCVSWFVLC